jgi:hypothetical protein
MKSVIKHAKPPLGKFPRLMASKHGDVVLFTSPVEGTVIHSADAPHGIGAYSANWPPSEFGVFHGTITLEND